MITPLYTPPSVRDMRIVAPDLHKLNSLTPTRTLDLTVLASLGSLTSHVSFCCSVYLLLESVLHLQPNRHLQRATSHAPSPRYSHLYPDGGATKQRHKPGYLRHL